MAQVQTHNAVGVVGGVGFLREWDGHGWVGVAYASWTLRMSGVAMGAGGEARNSDVVGSGSRDVTRLTVTPLGTD